MKKRRVNSLRWRLLLSAGGILLIFILFTGLALEVALSSYTRTAEFERLQGLSFSLLGAAEVDETWNISSDLSRVPAPRLNQPESGLFAIIVDKNGVMRWRSPSLIGIPKIAELPRLDEWRFYDDGAFTVTYGFEWIDAFGQIHQYGLIVSDSASPLQFRREWLTQRLWWWVSIISAALLVSLIVLTSWGLKPLKKIREELDEIREARRAELDESLPSEIAPLAESVNALLAHEQKQKTRFRNALADLAHSLKTPLAVLRNELGEDKNLTETLDHMDKIIGYQLQRAATAGGVPITARRQVSPLVDRIFNAMKKVYRDKNQAFINKLPDDYRLRIDEADLMELLGNLIDNAAKYGKDRVIVSVDEQQCLLIDDDGPGFPDYAARLVERGQRADTQKPGQGIGLAVVKEIVEAYGWELSLQKNPEQGGRVRICPRALELSKPT